MTHPRVLALGAAISLAVFAVLAWALYMPGVEARQDCEEVLSIGPETESQITEPFDIEGNSFRVSGNLRDVDNDGITQVIITPEDQETGLAADFIIADEEGPFDDNVLAGPGTFTLEIEVGGGANEYTVRVEDCGATPRGGPTGDAPQGGTTGPKTAPSPPPPPRPSFPPSPPPRPTPPPPAPMPPFKAGGASPYGPVPPMPNGSCPKEYPVRQGEACYGS